MNIKHIAATLALLGTASFAVTGCGKKGGEGTEVPTEGADKGGEGSCSADKADGEGSCSAEGGGEGSCSAEAGGEGSCSAEGGGEEGGEEAAEGGEEAAPEA